MTQPSYIQGLMTRMGFILGWVCFAIAFLAAAAESVHSTGFITSANDLLLALVPGKWIAFKARYASFLFDASILLVMELPGWLLAGFPAGLLLYTCRPHREEVEDDLLDSLTTYDRLAKMAAEEGAEDDDPTFEDLDVSGYDEDDLRDDELTIKKYMTDWQPGKESNEADERPMGPEEKMAKARKGMTVPFDKMT